MEKGFRHEVTYGEGHEVLVPPDQSLRVQEPLWSESCPVPPVVSLGKQYRNTLVTQLYLHSKVNSECFTFKISAYNPNTIVLAGMVNPLTVTSLKQDTVMASTIFLAGLTWWPHG
jgi:hypothetical protein